MSSADNLRERRAFLEHDVPSSPIVSVKTSSAARFIKGNQNSPAFLGQLGDVNNKNSFGGPAKNLTPGLRVVRSTLSSSTAVVEIQFLSTGSFVGCRFIRISD